MCYYKQAPNPKIKKSQGTRVRRFNSTNPNLSEHSTKFNRIKKTRFINNASDNMIPECKVNVK